MVRMATSSSCPWLLRRTLGPRFPASRGRCQGSLLEPRVEFRNHGGSTAVEGVRAAWCAPLRVGPRRWEVGFQVEHHIDAAGGGTGVLDEELHVHHSTGCEQHGVGLIGGQGQVNVVLEHRDAGVLKDDRVALDVLHFQANRVVACCDVRLVRERVKFPTSPLLSSLKSSSSKFFSNTVLAPLGVAMMRFTSSMSSRPKASRTSMENCISRKDGRWLGDHSNF